MDLSFFCNASCRFARTAERNAAEAGRGCVLLRAPSPPD
jgi:hypothetical protein